MARPYITNKLKGSLGELYYKEFCDQRGWAYISLESLHDTLNEKWVFTFKKGFNRIQIKIPENIRPEIKSIAHPTNSKEQPSFVFDFLACKVGTLKKYRPVNGPAEFCWAEIKTGDAVLSENQIDAMSKIQLPLAIFQIDKVLAPPFKIDLSYYMKSGKEWLAGIDQVEKQLVIKFDAAKTPDKVTKH